MKKTILSLLLLIVVGFSGFAQVTTSTISGIVKAGDGEILPGATVQILHIPTGTKYSTSTNKVGRYVVPSVRVGGPYKVTISFVGFKTKEQDEINTTLGETTNVDAVLIENNTSLKEVVVSAGKSNIISRERTGASQQFTRRDLQNIPITGARTIDGITKYNPNGNGNSFGAQDSR